MEYFCQHCNANLSEGDIFDVLFAQCNNYEEALEDAKHFGWSTSNKIHFKRARVIQCVNSRKQWTICPDCGKENPFKYIEN